MVIRFDMCVNQKEIKNKYTGKTLYVKCGHCKSCLQEKAAYRVGRIKNQDDPDKYTVLLVGLTYRRNCVPYIRRDDAYLFNMSDRKYLDVFRDIDYRKVRQNASYDIGYKKIVGTRKLCSVDFDISSSLKGSKDLKYEHGKIGVTYYPDAQHFLARLRLNLKRNYEFNKSFTTYLCSEYGTKSHRPHFHLLLWIPKGSEDVFKSAIVASWPYGDIQRRRYDEKSGKIILPAIQEAFNASSYVASYVNCGSDFPKFLKTYFKPKHSYSKGFGCNAKCFLLPSILEKFDKGHLTLFVRKDKQGLPIILEFPIPKYVIHRYFPLFKGYGRFSSASTSEVATRIYESFGTVKRNEFEQNSLGLANELGINKMSFPVYYSNEDLYKISVRLHNAYDRFCESAPDRHLSFMEYAYLHEKVWSLYRSDCLRLALLDEDIPLEEKYFNLEEIKCKVEGGLMDMPLGFTHEMFKNTDPNKFQSVMFRTKVYEDSYNDNIKHRRVSNHIYMQSSDEF